MCNFGCSVIHLYVNPKLQGVLLVQIAKIWRHLSSNCTGLILIYSFILHSITKTTLNENLQQWIDKYFRLLKSLLEYILLFNFMGLTFLFYFMKYVIKTKKNDPTTGHHKIKRTGPSQFCRFTGPLFPPLSHFRTQKKIWRIRYIQAVCAANDISGNGVKTKHYPLPSALSYTPTHPTKWHELLERDEPFLHKEEAIVASLCPCKTKT